MATLSIVLLAIAGPRPAPLLVWNASSSVPAGLYLVLPFRSPAVGDLVLARPTEPLTSMLAAGGYLPRGVPLLKRILAVSGQTICRHGRVLIVDGTPAGLAREYDSRGRLLPGWQGCHLLADDELFLMNRDAASSLDGRYFGAVPIASVIGRARPLWTRGAGENPVGEFNASTIGE